MERRTKLSRRKLVNSLKTIRSGSVTINGQLYPTEPEIPDSMVAVLKALNYGD